MPHFCGHNSNMWFWLGCFNLFAGIRRYHWWSCSCCCRWFSHDTHSKYLLLLLLVAFCLSRNSSPLPGFFFFLLVSGCICHICKRIHSVHFLCALLSHYRCTLHCTKFVYLTQYHRPISLVGIINVKCIHKCKQQLRCTKTPKTRQHRFNTHSVDSENKCIYKKNIHQADAEPGGWTSKRKCSLNRTSSNKNWISWAIWK